MEHRVFYVATFEEAIYVLHAFEKKSQKTPQHHLQVARLRWSELIQKRRELKSGKGHVDKS
jgi:phage-related protein